jgi:hypothetical protein
MKKVAYLFLIVLFGSSACASSEKLLEKGRYDQAIEKAAKKLRKNPNDSDELYVLQEAYSQANTFDKERIDFLEAENRDENWLEIYFLYSQLEQRQDVIRSLPTGVRTQFTLVDYDEEIIHSKESAAEAMYQQGMEYLDRGDRQSARLAYREFQEVKNIYTDYKDVNQRLREAQYLGTNFVLLRIENNSDKVLPEDFDTELRKIGLGELNSEWVRYETYPDTSIYYDYNIVLDIQEIAVSPEQVETRKYTEQREIQDGMKYVLDENGNVKKDSEGNDIREPNIVTVSADVTESIQRKSALVGGAIDYIDLQTNQLVTTEKISVEALLERFSALASGNKAALSEETRKKIGSRPAPFPSNEAMLMDAALKLKDHAKSIIYRNRDLLAN